MNVPRWAGPVIVTLPMSLYAYLESPVPLVLGIEQLPEHFELSQGTLLVYPDQDCVVLHSSDMRVSDGG